MINLVCNRILLEEQPCGVRTLAWIRDLKTFENLTLFYISISSPSLISTVC